MIDTFTWRLVVTILAGTDRQVEALQLQRHVRRLKDLEWATILVEGLGL